MPSRRPALLAEAGARVAADVKDPPLKAARFGNVSDRHARPESDEAFLPLDGRIATDRRDGGVRMEEGGLACVPGGAGHRPRAPTPEPVVLMFEPAATPGSGEARGRRAVAEARRL